MSDLSKHLREQAAIFRQEDSLGRGAKELEAAADLIEQQAALILSLESRTAQQARTIAAMCQQVADMERPVSPAVDAQAVATKEPAHKFAIIRDRNYDGEGRLSLWTWDGEYYVGADGDCLSPDPDGTLDGYTAEWLTDYQLETRLNDASAQSEGLRKDAIRREALEEAVRLVEQAPLESFATEIFVRQSQRNRQQIVDAIRALSQKDPQ